MARNLHSRRAIPRYYQAGQYCRTNGWSRLPGNNDLQHKLARDNGEEDEHARRSTDRTTEPQHDHLHHPPILATPKPHGIPLQQYTRRISSTNIRSRTMLHTRPINTHKREGYTKTIRSNSARHSRLHRDQTITRLITPKPRHRIFSQTNHASQLPGRTHRTTSLHEQEHRYNWRIEPTRHQSLGIEPTRRRLRTGPLPSIESQLKIS